MGEVIPLVPDRFTRAGELLARAFRDDPMWSGILPDSKTRSAHLVRMFTGLTKTIAVVGGVAETTPELEAAALWLPPGKELGFWAMVRSGFQMPRIAMGLPAPDRKLMVDILRQLEQRRKQLASEPHWYLLAIGVEPTHRGKGLGSALVRSGMRKADQAGTLIYLETDTTHNVAFYEHLGFEVVDEVEVVGLDVPIWLMIRCPHGADGRFEN